MFQAIRIRLSKSTEEQELSASRLFGTPLIPEEWAERFDDSVIFFGQIRLTDLAPYDPHNRFPHSGYLYFFLDTADEPYTAIVEHYKGDPKLLMEGFNELDPEFSHLSTGWTMHFELCDTAEDCTRLLGIPCSQPHEEGELLLQFDPLDNETGFLSEIDGYAYFFFGKGKDPIADVRFLVDQS